MRINQLSTKLIEQLERAFQKEKNGRQKIRYQSVWLLAKGWKKEQVAEVVGINKDRLRQLVTLYHKDGLAGLIYRPAPGNNHLLTKGQKEMIKDLIIKHTPEELGLSSKFWKIPQLKKLVKRQFGVRYQDQDSYRQLFLFCGFSFSKKIGELSFRYTSFKTEGRKHEVIFY